MTLPRITNSRLGLRLHVPAADLDIETVGIENVEAIFGVGTVFVRSQWSSDGRILLFHAPALELGFDFVLVPRIDRVGHVVDQWGFAHFTRRGVALFASAAGPLRGR